jgi:peptide/nickel transport system permease protein
MTAYIIRRFIQALAVLIIASAVVFLVMNLLPGDPIRIYFSSSALGRATPEQIALWRHEFGLDRPLIVQYVDWVSHVFRGDLGDSIMKGEKVSTLIARRLPITIYLGLPAFLMSLIFGITAGVLSAIKRGRPLDTGVTVFANLGICAPIFWVGIVMIYLFALYLGWLPTCGYTSPFEDFWLSTRQIIMPVFCLSMFDMAATARQTRSAMLEVTRQDYIRTAWAKGLRERTVIIRHALKNSLIPVIAYQGMCISDILGVSVIIETVFNIPGMGRLSVESIFNHDYAVIQGIILIIAIIVTMANLLVDLSYGWLDPRVRYE